uniref:Uncharacterized protein n=1 Tax=viral metagenome TaxID=1070528 RepID=A0A6M3J912_9ZZZZ
MKPKEKKIEIKAMMEDDMFKTLEKWGYMGALKDGYITCPCGEVITEDNLAGIKSKDGKVVFLHSITCDA